MARQCHVCGSEYRLQLDARLRAGDSHAVLAAEFGLSTDSIDRHAARHLDVQIKNPDASLQERFELLYRRAWSHYQAMATKGSDRQALDSLEVCVDLLDKLSKLRIDKIGFESLSLDEKVQYIIRDGELNLALFDYIVRTADIINLTREIEAKHGKFTETLDPSSVTDANNALRSDSIEPSP